MWQKLVERFYRVHWPVCLYWWVEFQIFLQLFHFTICITLSFKWIVCQQLHCKDLGPHSWSITDVIMGTFGHFWQFPSLWGLSKCCYADYWKIDDILEGPGLRSIITSKSFIWFWSSFICITIPDKWYERVAYQLVRYHKRCVHKMVRNKACCSFPWTKLFTDHSRFECRTYKLLQMIMRISS